MKPRIATPEGIYVLSRDGFYEPEPEPEEKRSGLWLAIGGPILFGLVCGAGYCLYRACEAWPA
jgi:hypothetical protein